MLKEKNKKNLNQNVIPDQNGNLAECMVILPLDFRVKPENDSQGGRSMVEMLGVLAIIGILSVAGIAAYSSAMTKHRANELLYEASKRATVVAMQAAQGKETLSISEFNNNAVLGFSETVGHADKQFTLTIVGVDDAVCNQVKKMAGGAIKKVEPATCSGDNNSVTLTYHEDLSTEAWASDFATENECTTGGKTWCSKIGTNGVCSESTDCCAGVDTACQTCDTETGELVNNYTLCQTCENGVISDKYNQCQTCDSETGEITNNYTQCQSCDAETGEITEVANSPATNCTISTENDGTCINGVCVKAGKACTDNTQCGGDNSGYFCAYYMEGDIGSEGMCSYTPPGARPNYNGQCVEITSSNSNSNGNYAWSTKKMDWWTAQNFCAAMQMHLPTVNSFQCYKDGTSTQIQAGSSVSGYCCKDDQHGNCSSYWNNATDRATYFSEKIVDVKEKVNTENIYWTADNTDSKCYPFSVHLKFAYVTNYTSKSNISHSYALCEK